MPRDRYRTSSLREKNNDWNLVTYLWARWQRGLGEITTLIPEIEDVRGYY